MFLCLLRIRIFVMSDAPRNASDKVVSATVSTMTTMQLPNVMGQAHEQKKGYRRATVLIPCTGWSFGLEEDPPLGAATGTSSRVESTTTAWSLHVHMLLGNHRRQQATPIIQSRHAAGNGRKYAGQPYYGISNRHRSDTFSTSTHFVEFYHMNLCSFSFVQLDFERVAKSTLQHHVSPSPELPADFFLPLSL